MLSRIRADIEKDCIGIIPRSNVVSHEIKNVLLINSISEDLIIDVVPGCSLVFITVDLDGERVVDVS